MFLQPHLLELLPAGVGLRYIGRPESASPSEGSGPMHDAEQARIVREALSGTANATSNGAYRENGSNGAGPKSATAVPTGRIAGKSK
jgi:hypothetical protein